MLCLRCNNGILFTTEIVEVVKDCGGHRIEDAIIDNYDRLSFAPNYTGAVDEKIIKHQENYSISTEVKPIVERFMDKVACNVIVSSIKLPSRFDEHDKCHGKFFYQWRVTFDIALNQATLFLRAKINVPRI